ncbi:MAG: hypothetical protein WA905_18530, partial [Pseudolabrys sp.]
GDDGDELWLFRLAAEHNTKGYERDDVCDNATGYREVQLRAGSLLQAKNNRGSDQHSSESDHPIAVHAPAGLAFAIICPAHVGPWVVARRRVAFLARLVKRSLVLLVERFGLLLLFSFLDHDGIVGSRCLRENRPAQKSQHDGAHNEFSHGFPVLAPLIE